MEAILNVIRFNDNEKETLSNITITSGKDILFSCVGLELPWFDNKKMISCIPVGDYDCVKRTYSANIPYPHIVILNVPNRTGICVHKANFARQLKGCIAIGDKHVDIDRDNLIDITNSGRTFNTLMKLLPNKFKLKLIKHENNF